MPRGRRVAALLTLVVVLAAGAVTAGEPYWPSEKEARLKEISSEIRAALKEQHAARLRGDEKTAAKIEERVEALGQEQVKLLRSLGRYRDDE